MRSGGVGECGVGECGVGEWESEGWEMVWGDSGESGGVGNGD